MTCPHCDCDDHGAENPGFSRLDADFVRVLEDVIDALIARNVINITDLPDEAQAKLMARKTFRDRLGPAALRLFDDTEFSDVIGDARWQHPS